MAVFHCSDPSSSKFVASGFAVQNKGLIYVISDPGSGQAVKYGLKFMHLAGESETVFTSISGGSIKGAFTLNGAFVPNPGFVG